MTNVETDRAPLEVAREAMLEKQREGTDFKQSPGHRVYGLTGAWYRQGWEDALAAVRDQPVSDAEVEPAAIEIHLKMCVGVGRRDWSGESDMHQREDRGVARVALAAAREARNA